MRIDEMWPASAHQLAMQTRLQAALYVRQQESDRARTAAHAGVGADAAVRLFAPAVLQLFGAVSDTAASAQPPLHVRSPYSL